MTERSSDGIQKKAYEALNGFFNRHSNEAVEIEILPPAFPPPDGILMQEGANLGIPKKILALAFLEARAIFFNGIETDDVSSAEAFEASRVILLFDPEHITAANFRKRRLLGIERASGESGAFNQAVNQELVYLNSILTSPLHRQSKSPTLWYHRTWLLRSLIPAKLSGNEEPTLDSFLLNELDAVCKASERHPKNYYAWQHARRLFAKVEQLKHHGTHSLENDAYESFISKAAQKVQQWCLQNPSDVSGWSFLLFLLQRVQSVHERSGIVKRVLDFAINLNWAGESLWVFLRTALAESSALEEETMAVHRLHNYQNEKEKSKDSTHIDKEDFCQKAVEWIQKYSNA